MRAIENWSILRISYCHKTIKERGLNFTKMFVNRWMIGKVNESHS